MTARRVELRIKSALDRFVAGMLLVLFAPLFLLIALAIKLDGGEAVFFRQERPGRSGRTFRIWKFRTMIPDAHALGGGYFPTGVDLVTRVGRFLRKTSLDELPQLLNILAGDMAFVGPRPTLPEQVARYTPRQRRRLEVKPGLAGWAQLHGRNELPWTKRIEYDLEYLDRFSLLFDLRILVRTVPMVLFGSGVRMDQTAADRIDDLCPANPRATVEDTP